QDWGGNQAVFDVSGFREDQDRETTIMVFKASHIFDVTGGLETSFKYKTVNDEDTRVAGTTTDDVEIDDSGYSITVGNQLANDLYGSIGFGSYERDDTTGTTTYNNKKDIISLRFAYNLAGFEAGMLTQWIDGEGLTDDDNNGSTAQVFGDISQYRMKAYAKVLF
ncbi:MAG TPA: hypothetical protein VFY78_02875, partial [Gammaproteobacteria bacterium]|nr:hypothetical protein [Gammaproteobacteria bacterium]